MNNKKNRAWLRTGELCLKMILILGTASLFLSSCDDDDSVIENPSEEANVKLVRVDPITNSVTLRNFGEADQDISEFWFCIRRNYSQFSSVNNDGDDLILSPNEEITFDLTLDEASSDVAIYNIGGQFGNPSAIEDFMQYGEDIGSEGRVDVAVSAGIWIAAEFVDGFAPYEYTGGVDDRGAEFWEATGSGNANVRFVAVDPLSDAVVLRNFGNAAQDLSDYWFCFRRSYVQIGTLVPTSGDLILEPNEEVEFIRTIQDASSDIALYNTGGAFGSSEAIVDFMQFGEDVGSAGRVDVAVAAGIWTAGDFVEGVAPYQFNGVGDDRGANFWQALGTETNESNIRIIGVDPSADEVTLKNFGATAEDVSSYWFCLRRSYSQLSTLSSADLTLDPDEEITITVTIEDGSSDVALYFNNSGFGNADNLIDFMQFGADVGSAGRVDVAVAAGIWTAGEFVDGLAPFAYLGDADDRGESTWGDDANIRFITIEPGANEVVVKNFDTQERDISSYFFCTEPGVYPSFSNSSEVEIVSGDLQLSPNEEVRVRVVTTGGVIDGTGGIFLFSSNFLGFNNSNSVVLRDFAQWGAANGFRSDNAVAAGRWDNAANFIDGNEPYNFIGGPNDIGASFWETTEPSAVRILSVDPVNDRIVLKNFGQGAQDLSDYWFCLRRNYIQLGTLTPESGDLILDPNEEVGFSQAIEDASSDVALYNTGGQFGNASAIVDFMQFGDDVGSAGRVDVAVSAGIWTAGDFVNGVGPYSFDGDETENGVSFWTAAAAGQANVRILTVDPVNDEVVLKNFGTSSQDISGWFFCRRKVYSGFSTLSVASGNLILAPGEEIEFSVTIDDTSSDVAVYLNNSGFANAANIHDFMQFGDDVGSAGRVDVAVSAGIWSTGDFVNGVGPYSFDGDETENGVSFWSATAAGQANVRILTVDPVNDEVVLKNFGTSSQDISGWFFCRRKVYSGFSTLSVASGNLILAPGEEIEFSVTIDDTSSDVAVYLNNSGFANAANIHDFMQFGADVGTAGRVDVAVTAGLWTAGDFVANPGPFEYSGDGTQNGVTFW